MRLLFVLLATLVVVVPASALSPSPRIAFNAGLTTGNPDVVTIAPDGSDLRNLTPGTPAFYSSDLNPSWSPDGARIAFESHRDSNVATEIYVMNADGTDQRRLTTDSGQASQLFNVQPVWSPRGDLIAFEKSRQSGQNYDIWVMHPDGSGQRPLTSDGGLKSVPSWSPDGTRLVYTRQTSPGNRIYTVGLDGALPVPLFGANAWEYYPTWSPDGSQIAFSASSLTVMNADGSNRRSLTPIGIASPVWSPDGTRIAFAGYRSFPQYGSRFGIPSRTDVFVIDAFGGNLRRLTGPFADDELYGAAGGQQPTWWPDGSRLFFVSQRYPDPETTFQMNADGSCEGRFAPVAPQLQRPVWSPGAVSVPPPLRCAELRIRAETQKSTVALNERASFTLTVDNDGNLPASLVKVHVDVTVGIGVTLYSSSTGCTSPGASLTCVLDVIAPHQSATLTIFGARSAGGAIRLKAHVSATEPDTDPTNNDAEFGADVLPCTVVGSYGNDYLVGTPKADKICALPGADTIFAGKGNDFIDAGNGEDKIYPGPGNDTVIAKGGDDTIYARDGRRDWIDCGAQADIAIVDRLDVLRHCEYVLRGKS